jgi:hypothetical protein
MSVIANPHTDPDAWGSFIVGGSPMPGILTSIGLPDRAYEYAIQNGYGSTKVVIYRATGIIDGLELVHFLRPTTDTDLGDWDKWETWMKSMVRGWPAKFAGKPPAFPAVHPATQIVGMSKMSLKTYGAPYQQIPNDPSYWYKVSFVEYAPQTKIPTGPTEPAQINGPPQPKDAFEAMVLNGLGSFLGRPATTPNASPAVATGSAT